MADGLVNNLEGISLSSLLECSVCLDMCTGGIKQCKNGHNICASHVPRLHECPLCRVPFSQGLSRNLLAEKLVAIERRKRQVEETRRQMGSMVVTTPTVQASAGLRRNNAPNTVPTVVSPSNNNPGYSGMISCEYATEGCTYRNAAHRTQQHGLNCHYRPIECCLKTDGCNNAQIPFSEYIHHLINTHNVKHFEGSRHWNNFYVKDDRKLVRDGSSSLVILEVDNDTFLVRAKQVEDRVYVWVAFHGRPQDGRKYTATIKFDFPGTDDGDEEDSDDEEDNDDYDDYESESSEDDDEDMDPNFDFSGTVKATTRMDVEDVQNTNSYLDMWEGDIENNLGTERVRGRQFESWAVNININRC